MTTKESYTTPNGQEVLLQWHETSPHVADAYPLLCGVLTHMIEAYCNEAKVGHLRVSYTTKESVRAVYPTGLMFLSSHHGWSLPFDDPCDLWVRAHLCASATPQSHLQKRQPLLSWQLSREDAPDAATIEKDLAVLHRRGIRERNAWCAATSVPVVVFVRVASGEYGTTNWQRQGIARTMYKMAAKKLGARGLSLRASTLQSDEAVEMWKSFEACQQMPTRQLPSKKVPSRV
jgi:hypothetical protein